MTTKIAGHLLVECLVAQGVTHAFGVPGASYLALLEDMLTQAVTAHAITGVVPQALARVEPAEA